MVARDSCQNSMGLVQLQQASDPLSTLDALNLNYNSKYAVPIFHDSLSYYKRTDSCLCEFECEFSVLFK